MKTGDIVPVFNVIFSAFVRNSDKPYTFILKNEAGFQLGFFLGCLIWKDKDPQ